MTDLPIVSLLRRGHAQPCECVECTAAALIREMEAALEDASDFISGDDRMIDHRVSMVA